MLALPASEKRTLLLLWAKEKRRLQNTPEPAPEPAPAAAPAAAPVLEVVGAREEGGVRGGGAEGAGGAGGAGGAANLQVEEVVPAPPPQSGRGAAERLWQRVELTGLLKRADLNGRRTAYLLWPYLLWPYLLWPYLLWLRILRLCLPRPYLLWPYLRWAYLLRQARHDRALGCSRCSFHRTPRRLGLHRHWHRQRSAGRRADL